MCTTPFDARTLGVMTVALLILTVLPWMVTVRFFPSKVAIDSLFVRLAASTLPLTTWYSRTSVKLFVSFSKA